MVNYRSTEVRLAIMLITLIGASLAVAWFTSETDIGKNIATQITTSPGITAIELVLFLVFIVGVLLMVKGIWKLFIGPVPGFSNLGGIFRGLRNDIIVIAIALALLLMFNHGWFGTNWTIISP